MAYSKHQMFHIAEFIRNTWIIMAALGGIVWWAARQDSSLADVKENRTKIGMLETRIAILETGLQKLQIKIDGIREDLVLIKTAVLK